MIKERTFKFHWGKSVFYKDMKSAHHKVIVGEKIAEKFLDKLNKRKSVEWITVFEFKDGKWSVLG